MYTAIILAGTAGLFAGFLSFVQGDEDLGLVLCFAGVLTVLTGVFTLWFNNDSTLEQRNRPADEE